MTRRIPTFAEFVGMHIGQLELTTGAEIDMQGLETLLYELREPYRLSFQQDRHPSVEWFKKKYILDLKMLTTESHSVLTEGQHNGYVVAELLTTQALLWGQLQMGRLYGKILDFGCGVGGSSIYLRQYSEDVTAIDLDEKAIAELKQSKLFDPNKAIHGNGFEYMERQPENSIDLLTSFFLGEFDESEIFLARFFDVGRKIVKPNGLIFIINDLTTMDTIREILVMPYDGRGPPNSLVYNN